jgi:hypothetical protein
LTNERQWDSGHIDPEIYAPRCRTLPGIPIECNRRRNNGDLRRPTTASTTLLLTSTLLTATTLLLARAWYSAPGVYAKNQQSGKAKSHWQTMPSNSAAQSRPANFAKTETHIFTIRCHDDFLYFFSKKNYCTFSHASVSCSSYRSWSDQLLGN